MDTPFQIVKTLRGDGMHTAGTTRSCLIVKPDAHIRDLVPRLGQESSGVNTGECDGDQEVEHADSRSDDGGISRRCATGESQNEAEDLGNELAFGQAENRHEIF